MTKHDPDRLKQKLFDFAKDFAFFKHMGLSLIDFGPQWAKCQITLKDELRNANGVMHGGVIATLMDAAITQSMLMTDVYQEIRETRGQMTTVDLRVKYLRPVTDGTATCEAEITHLGRRIAHATATVKNDAGKVVATGDSIVMITLGDRKSEG